MKSIVKGQQSMLVDNYCSTTRTSVLLVLGELGKVYVCLSFWNLRTAFGVETYYFNDKILSTSTCIINILPQTSTLR